ncbi:MAG TPA: AraC family transcriptional regulator [Ruminococcus sp.]|nr:AraC family transcriptional regulator [Ruminococcus sp.]
MEIQTNQLYEMKNVISYRAKMTQQEVNDVMNRMGTFIQEKGLNKSGCVTTTTFNIESTGAMDIEILCPVDKVCDVPQGFIFKPEFRLSNAAKITHKGNPANMQESVNKLIGYLNKNKLTPVTSLYNVTVNEPITPMDIDNMVVDMYIGVTDNIL